MGGTDKRNEARTRELKPLPHPHFLRNFLAYVFLVITFLFWLAFFLTRLQLLGFIRYPVLGFASGQL